MQNMMRMGCQDGKYRQDGAWGVRDQVKDTKRQRRLPSAHRILVEHVNESKHTVGEIVSISSSLKRLRMVVFPALSRPLPPGMQQGVVDGERSAFPPTVKNHGHGLPDIYLPNHRLFSRAGHGKSSGRA
jgi:hypothetical protein